MNEAIGEFLKLAPGVEWLMQKPLRLAVLYAMASRAMKNPERVCFMSKNEFKKFGLKKSQWNQIERVLRDLETGNKRATYVSRTGRVDEETGAIEFRLIDNIFIDTSKTNKKAQRASHGQPTGNKRAQTKEKSRYKKEIYKEKSLESKSIQPYEESEEPLQSSAKVSPVAQQVLNLAAKFGVTIEVNVSFELLEERFDSALIIKKAEDMFIWLIDNKKVKATTARLLTFLKRAETETPKKMFEVRGATYANTPAMRPITVLEEKHPDLMVQKKVQHWLATKQTILPDDLALSIQNMASGPTKRWCEKQVSNSKMQNV